MNDASRAVRLNLVQVAYGDDETPAARLERVGNVVRQAPDADLIVLPELWTAGGFAYDHWTERAELIDGPFATYLSLLAAERRVVLHAGSFIEQAGGRLYNTSLVFGRDGSRLGVYRKIHRFGEGEKSALGAGDALATVSVRTSVGAKAVAGLATCYDLRFPELFRGLLSAGSEILIIPAAWPASRVGHWQTLGEARAIENQCYVVQCNTAGTHAGVEMGGCSQVVGPDGKVLGVAGTTDEVLSVELDFDAVGRLRRSFDVLSDRRLTVGASVPVA